MGTRVIIQENGQFGLYSTISDRIEAFDCDEAEMIEIWKERAASKAEQEMKDWLAAIKSDGRHFPRYNEATITIKKALKNHNFISEDIVKEYPNYKGEFDFDQKIKERFQ